MAAKRKKVDEIHSWLNFLPDAMVVLKDGNPVGRIVMDDVDIAFFEPCNGAGFTNSDLAGIIEKMAEMEERARESL